MKNLLENKITSSLIQMILLMITLTALFCALAGCGKIKQNNVISTQNNDCEMTDKQWRKYLNFVKDSLKIEAKTKQIEIKYEYKTVRDSFAYEKIVYKFDTKKFADSLKAVKQMYSDSLTYRIKLVKSDNGLIKSEIKQEKKTERTKARNDRWVWIFIGFILSQLLKWLWILVINFIKFQLNNR